MRQHLCRKVEDHGKAEKHMELEYLPQADQGRTRSRYINRLPAMADNPRPCIAGSFLASSWFHNRANSSSSFRFCNLNYEKRRIYSQVAAPVGSGTTLISRCGRCFSILFYGKLWGRRLFFSVTRDIFLPNIAYMKCAVT